MFSLGYLMGVLITMKIVAKRENQDLDFKITTPNSVVRNSDPWETFSRLTQVNYNKHENKLKKSFTEALS